MARWMRLVGAGVLVVLSAGVLASCGSDETRLSKADFVKQVDALCKAREKAFAVLDDENFFDPKVGAPMWADLKKPGQAFVDGVLDLDSPPEGFDAKFDRYRDGVKEIPELLDDIASAAKDGDLKPYNQHMSDLFADQQGDIDMAEYGAKECYDPEEALPQSQEPAKGATVVEVGAKEYEFDIADDIHAGKVAFKLVNNGEQMHIFGFGRLNEGATFDQLKAEIDAGNEPELMTDEGLTGIAGPERTSTTNAELEPGTYVAYCFIPSPDGTSHMSQGMLAPFEVS